MADDQSPTLAPSSIAADVLSTTDILWNHVAPFLQVQDLGRLAQSCKCVHAAAVSWDGKLVVPVQVIQVTSKREPVLKTRLVSAKGGLPRQEQYYVEGPAIFLSPKPFLFGYSGRHLRILRVAANERGERLDMGTDETPQSPVRGADFVSAALEGLQAFLHSDSAVEVVSCPLILGENSSLQLSIRQTLARSLFVLPALQVLEIPAEVALTPIKIYGAPVGSGNNSRPPCKLRSFQIHDGGLSEWGKLDEQSLAFRLTVGAAGENLRDFGFSFAWSHVPAQDGNDMKKVPGQVLFENVLPRIETLRLFCGGTELLKQPWFQAIRMQNLKHVQFGTRRMVFRSPPTPVLPVANVKYFRGLEGMHFRGMTLDYRELGDWLNFFATLSLRRFRLQNVGMSEMMLGTLYALLGNEVGKFFQTLRQACREKLRLQIETAQFRLTSFRTLR
ncbi:unnamed protein product [Amoebophrya sp. A120]|nr:unnamed protein product [Amoebophrya sp. A120]|eukprot:GSA120T00021649001.1